MPVEQHLAALQRHTTERRMELPRSAKDLCRSLRGALVQASNARKLVTPPGDVHRFVQLLEEPPPTVLKELREKALHHGAFCIAGGDKNQGRDRSLPHFERRDGAWFDFSIIVREVDGAVVLLAYDFEIRLAPGMGAPFLRFDLNLPDHRNQGRELRCHLHPGSDDILVPAPMMSPAEILALFIDSVRPPAERQLRRPTVFEQTWLEHTISAAAVQKER